jgi:hypothetical protein
MAAFREFQISYFKLKIAILKSKSQIEIPSRKTEVCPPLPDFCVNSRLKNGAPSRMVALRGRHRRVFETN